MMNNPPFLLSILIYYHSSAKGIIMLEKKITDLIEKPLDSLGYELVRIQFVNNDVLQIMIDKEGGVNIQDCTKATRLINNILQVAEISDYGLEVSSPGMDRPLIKPEHYKRFIGENIKITTNELIDNRKKFIGKLEQYNAENNSIEIISEEKKLSIDLDQIAKANLHYQPIVKERKRN